MPVSADLTCNGRFWRLPNETYEAQHVLFVFPKSPIGRSILSTTTSIVPPGSTIRRSETLPVNQIFSYTIDHSRNTSTWQHLTLTLFPPKTFLSPPSPTSLQQNPSLYSSCSPTSLELSPPLLLVLSFLQLSFLLSVYTYIQFKFPFPLSENPLSSNGVLCSNQRPGNCTRCFTQEAQFRFPKDVVFRSEIGPNGAFERVCQPTIQRRRCSKGRTASHSERESCGYRFGDD